MEEEFSLWSPTHTPLPDLREQSLRLWPEFGGTVGINRRLNLFGRLALLTHVLHEIAHRLRRLQAKLRCKNNGARCLDLGLCNLVCHEVETARFESVSSTHVEYGRLLMALGRKEEERVDVVVSRRRQRRKCCLLLAPFEKEGVLQIPSLKEHHLAGDPDAPERILNGTLRKELDDGTSTFHHEIDVARRD